MWQMVLAGLLLAVITTLAAFLCRPLTRRPPGEKIEITVESGGTLNLTLFDYQDGVAESIEPRVKAMFAEARLYYANREYSKAREMFVQCLELEESHEKRGAINLQIGNCYYSVRQYIKAVEFYTAGLREAQKAHDLEGQASNLVNLANTYIGRPASTGMARGENVRKAVACYMRALEIFEKDEYPVQYAATQNNLGTAYTDLPSATSEERSENIRKAIECYRAALEIQKKDEYPVDYAMTQNNLGNAYTDLPSATPEERSENVRKAIECYLAALEIYKKDEYPVDYAMDPEQPGECLYRPSFSDV